MCLRSSQILLRMKGMQRCELSREGRQMSVTLSKRMCSQLE